MRPTRPGPSPDGRPHPDYPEFPGLWARAAREAPRFVSPQYLASCREVTARRGHDWATAVLGRPFPGLRGLNVPETQLLVLADAADIDPPLPAAVIAARTQQQASRAAHAARRAALEAADERRWQTALSRTPVDPSLLRVQANMTGRRTGTGVDTGPLRHIVPVQDLTSGPSSRPRTHRADRPLCETATRARPRRLSDAVSAPATCKSCLAHLPNTRLPTGP